MILSILFLLIGLILGFAIGFILFKKKPISNLTTENTSTLKEEIATLNARLAAAVDNYKEQKSLIEKLTSENKSLISENAHLSTANQNFELKLKEQKQEITTLQEKFTKEFSLIANKLLKQNATEFAEANQKKLTDILTPLKENIKSFEQKVEDKYEKELKERTTLIEQIKSLEKLNTQMSEDALKLTKALQGDNKAQGNWGELILEKVLESSGLIKGEEFVTQHSTTNDEGSRIQPDVVILLPDNKHIIVDAKVSLIAYQNYINATDKKDQETYLKSHLTSVKNHIKGLSEKHYAAAKGIDSPDFVLLFMPIESSFGLAMKTDNQLYQYAWDKKVVIVTPSTLLATLKTIKSVWNNEKQTKNALEIARQAGALHDKFVGFIGDMEKIKKSLLQSNTAYDSAFNKLKTGNGNLIDATIKIKKLGAKTKKSLPDNLLPTNNHQIEE